MADRNRKRDSFTAGAGLLAAAVYVCVQGLKRVERRLAEKKSGQK